MMLRIRRAIKTAARRRYVLVDDCIKASHTRIVELEVISNFGNTVCDKG